MAKVVVDSDKIREFEDEAGFYEWLRVNHDKESEVWIRIFKVASGIESISPKEAIDAALCWGWIDAIRKGLDEVSYLQRYTPRGKKSVWSKINVQNVERLIEEGRMTEHGLRHVEAAKADGRWERAYESGRNMKIPAELQAAIDASPAARETFAKLNAQNRYALAYRVHNLKTEAGRKRKIASFVEMLERGETIYPQKLDRD